MLTASVVLYNTCEKDLIRLLNSYSPCNERRLFIIDNSPMQADYINHFVNENIFYIYNNKNMGYGAAHNIGIKKAIELNSKYHIVLNPDVYFETNSLEGMINYLDSNDDVYYLLPKVIYPNGDTQYLCKLLPTPFDLFFRRFMSHTRLFEVLNNRYTLKKFGYNKIINPPCLSGCFMLLRISKIKEHNLFFDERYFMYFEDFDLIRRIHKFGKTVFFPYEIIIHDHARGSYKDKKLLLMHIKSAIKYFNKYGWIIDKERKRYNDDILREIELYEK